MWGGVEWSGVEWCDGSCLVSLGCSGLSNLVRGASKSSPWVAGHPSVSEHDRTHIGVYTTHSMHTSNPPPPPNIPPDRCFSVLVHARTLVSFFRPFLPFFFLRSQRPAGVVL